MLHSTQTVGSSQNNCLSLKTTLLPGPERSSEKSKAANIFFQLQLYGLAYNKLITIFSETNLLAVLTFF